MPHKTIQTLLVSFLGLSQSLIGLIILFRCTAAMQVIGCGSGLQSSHKPSSGLSLPA